MSALSQDSYLNKNYPLFYLNDTTNPDPPPVPPIPPPPVPPTPPVPEPPVNTPGNFGIGGVLIVGAPSQNIVNGDPRPAGQNGQLEIKSTVDATYTCWNEFVGTQSYATAVTNQANSAIWISGTADGIGGIEVISGIATTANTYNTQVNVTADMTVAGTLICGSIVPTNPRGVVNFVYPTYTTNPGGAAVIGAFYNPVGGFNINVSSLAYSRNLTVRVISGVIYNNNPSPATVVPVWCDLQTKPAPNAAFSPEIFSICATNDFSSYALRVVNGNSQLQTTTANSGPGNIDGSLLMVPVVVTYPTSGNLTLWAGCDATAQPVWFSNLSVEVRGD